MKKNVKKKPEAAQKAEIKKKAGKKAARKSAVIKTAAEKSEVRMNAAKKQTKTEVKQKAGKKGKKISAAHKNKTEIKKEKNLSAKKEIAAKETVLSVPDEREVKIESFFYNLSSLQKSGTDPKGTMLVAKYKQHEIGIHVDPKLPSLMFSYYPKQGNGEMINIPISIKDIISFIAQKAG